MFPLLFASVLWSVLIYVVLFLVMVFAVEAESGVWAVMLLIASTFIISWLGQTNPFAYIKAHPIGILECLLIYLAVGALWSIVKWALHVHTKVAEYKDAKADYMRRNNLTELTPEDANKLLAYAKATPPNARDNKSRIIRWMTYWPFSIIGSIFNDVIKKIYRHIYELLQSTYQRISDKIFSSVKGDVELANQYRDDQASRRRPGRVTESD